jgi:hypothetical protein
LPVFFLTAENTTQQNAQNKNSNPTELSNSLIVTSIEDVEHQDIAGKKQTQCEYAVDRIRSVDGRFFSVVPTVHWLGGAEGVKSFAFKDPVGNYRPPTAELVQRWQKGLEDCFRYAVGQGIEGLQVLNHIDAYQGKSWRNLLDFEPTTKYDGWSYEDLVLRPTASALANATLPETKIWYMVSGEMGRSLFEHPKEFTQLIRKYRGPLQAGRVNATDNGRVGVAIHWNKVCGDCVSTAGMPAGTDAEYNSSYAKAFEERGPEILVMHDLLAIRDLFEEADVIGISHYAPVGPVATPMAFDVAANTAAFELSYWGIDLRKLVGASSTAAADAAADAADVPAPQQRRREFLLSEVGLGGAQSDSRTPARTAAEAAALPLHGIWAVYNRAQDPWQLPEMRRFRRHWSRLLIDYVGKPWTRTWPIDGAFLWSVGSWDLAGVNPMSTSREGTFADRLVMTSMRLLSARVDGGRRRLLARRLLLQ